MLVFVFFFKQKTAYEMRISDWSSDVCSSDLFNDADTVIVADVYAAGENPIEGVSRDALVEGLRMRGHRRVIALPAPDQLAALVEQEAAPGDLVVRSEEHTSELQSLMRISYAVFCLKKNKRSNEMRDRTHK